jgi:hypothetical protein
MESLVNKVADSGIVTLNLEDYYPKEPVVLFDLKDYLFMGLILKEKDFRESLKQLDTAPYAGKLVAVTCSADAIIPVWAYMLVASLLQPVSAGLVYADEATAATKKLLENIQQLDVSAFTDQRIVLKGCGELPIPEEAYIKATERLRPVAKSIMYGEPCSTVPVYKKKTTA